MKEETANKFKEFVREYILEKGELVSEKPSFYGWGDYGAKIHEHFRKGCEFEFTDETEIRENWVDEFQGSFYEGDTRRVYLDATNVRCKCGDFTNRTLRASGNISEMLGELFS